MSFVHLQTGEAVIITTYTGRRVPAVVKLASANGLSLALTFDAMIGGWLGGLAAFWDEPSSTWRTLDGIWLEISRSTDDDADVDPR
jgi:hypothetical protein